MWFWQRNTCLNLLQPESESVYDLFWRNMEDIFTFWEFFYINMQLKSFLMDWKELFMQLKEPEHQQQWYWPSFPEYWYQEQKGWCDHNENHPWYYHYYHIFLHILVLIKSVFTWIWWLTHWGRVTHVCVSDLSITGSDNGLSPGRRQAIIWTNDGILFIRPLGTNFSEILIENSYIFIQENALENVVWKLSAILSQTQYEYCKSYHI